MATVYDNGEQNSIGDEIMEQEPLHLIIAGGSDNGESLYETERTRPTITTSLSRRTRSQILREPEDRAESPVDNAFIFIGIDFGTTFVLSSQDPCSFI